MTNWSLGEGALLRTFLSTLLKTWRRVVLKFQTAVCVVCDLAVVMIHEGSSYDRIFFFFLVWWFFRGGKSYLMVFFAGKKSPTMEKGTVLYIYFNEMNRRKLEAADMVLTLHRQS